MRVTVLGEFMGMKARKKVDKNTGEIRFQQIVSLYQSGEEKLVPIVYESENVPILKKGDVINQECDMFQWEMDGRHGITLKAV